MLKRLSVEAKVGLFALLCLVIIIFATLKLGDRSIVAGGGYEIEVVMNSAIGIKTKTPVEIAGIQIGVVKKIKLDESRRAKVILLVSDNVRLPEGSVARVRAKGFLGQTFVEIIPGPSENPTMKDKSVIPYAGVTGDVNMLMTQFNEIASDIKSVTGSLKQMVGSDESSPVFRAVNNVDTFTERLKDMTLRNEASLNRVVDNLAILTDQLRTVVARDMEGAMDNIYEITEKVNRGEGSIGKLVNDEATVNKINDSLDNLNDALGGLRRLETQIGYHTEYLGGTKDLKHYVHLNLKPTPDEAFLFEFVSDPDASPVRVTRDTTITAGGATSTVQTHTSTVDENRFLFSAELAKDFYDFRLRGGIIESTGGVGLDYIKGPASVQFSAFDFTTKYGQKPHLKLLGKLNVTKGLYLVGGADDIINPTQPVDWFVGAGIQMVDEDVKSLLGLGAKAAQ